MTPLSAELIAAPAALMVLLAMMWYRRHRDTRVATAHDVAEDGFDDRFKRFMTTSRRRGDKDQRVDDDVATTGIIPVAAVETAATEAPALTHTAPVHEDAVFGPSADVADEPDWDAMRLPHTPEPQELAHETAPEITAPPVAPAPPAGEGELITRPGWPLPGDLEAWESADFASTPAPPTVDPGLGHWAEVAAARTEEPVGTDDRPNHDADTGAPGIVLGAPYPAPAMAPPASFAGSMEPPAGSLAEPPFTSFGDGVDAIGEPAAPVSPSADPSFWEVGPSVTAVPDRVEPRPRRRSTRGRRRPPRRAPARGVPTPRAPRPHPNPRPHPRRPATPPRSDRTTGGPPRPPASSLNRPRCPMPDRFPTATRPGSSAQRSRPPRRPTPTGGRPPAARNPRYPPRTGGRPRRRQTHTATSPHPPPILPMPRIRRRYSSARPQSRPARPRARAGRPGPGCCRALTPPHRTARPQGGLRLAGAR